LVYNAKKESTYIQMTLCCAIDGQQNIPFLSSDDYISLIINLDGMPALDKEKYMV